MSWAAVGVGAAGIVAGFVQNNNGPKNKSVPATVYNAYGEANQPIKGAITSRDNIFNAINGDAFQSGINGASNLYTSRLKAAAYDPRLSAISNYGSDVLAGRYLTSPVVTGYANQAADTINAAGADEAARSAALYTRGGQGFSTGMLQALQSARTAAAQKAATTRAGILSSNYQNERNMQQGATDIVSNSVNQPLNYLGQVTGAMYQPYQLQAGLTTQLLGQNQIHDPTLIQQPNAMSSIASGINTAAGLYSLYKGVNTPSTGKG